MNFSLKNIELRLRGIVPAPLRKLYRISRSMGAGKASKALPPELVQKCQFCATRHHMLDLLPKEAIIAELGTYKGDFARHIVSKTNPKELHLIDLDYSKFNEDGLTIPCVKRHRGLVHEVISTFEDEYFDWIYVDADHSFEGVIRDARAAANKIKPGGYMVFNDFAHIDPSLGRYGVHRAVVDFALENKWEMRFFAFQSNALYDVALQKPLVN